MYLRFFILILFIIVSCNDAKDNKPVFNVVEKINSNEMNKISFDEMIKSYSEKIKENTELDTNDYILLVKIYNTIAFNKLWHMDTLYGNFSKLYFHNVMKKSKEILGAEKGADGMWHSKKHDLYIGNPQDMKSRFTLSDSSVKK